MKLLKILILVSSTGFMLGCESGFETLQKSSSTSTGNASTPPSTGTDSPQPPQNNDNSIPGRSLQNLNVFFMGHSLVGPDLPGLVGQLSEAHSVPATYNSQVGWGTTMRAHWEYYTTGSEFPGLFTGASDHRDAHQAVLSGDYNVIVLTEMVEIMHAVNYFQSDDYSGRWAGLADQNSPNSQVYLYETWPNLDVMNTLNGDDDLEEYNTGRHDDYWLDKIEVDHDMFWKNRLLNPMNAAATNNEVLMIPAGQVMKEFVIHLESTQGGIGGISNRQALYSDNIHLSDYGLYLVGLAQISTILDRSPCNLPANWSKSSGNTEVPTQALAMAMKNVVKRVLAQYRDITGVSFTGESCSP